MDTPVEWAPISYWGEEEYDVLASAMDIAGDLNADGYDDLLLTSSYNDENGDNAGQVYVVFGRATGWDMDVSIAEADASFLGEVEDDYVGNWHSTRGVGDVNGDGFDDLLIGSSNNSEVGYMAGQAWLVMGQASGWEMDVDLNLADASFLAEDELNWAGRALDGAGDVNGDGYDDLLIGAPLNEDVVHGGQAYLIFGGATGWAMDLPLAWSDASYLPQGAGDNVGDYVSRAGDVNADGYGDFLIAAPLNDEAASAAGQVYLILGGAYGWSMDTNLSSADASFHGEGEGTVAGALADVGDVNGDGFDDFIIAAVGGEYVCGILCGTTYLILGKASGWSMDVDLGSADASFLGEEEWDRAGLFVSGADDVNSDGYDDFLISTYDSDENGEDAGQTYLIFGKLSGWSMDTDLGNVDASFLGQNENDASGWIVAGGGDINADGVGDFLISSVRSDEGGDYAGQVYIFPNDPHVCTDNDGDGYGRPGIYTCPAGQDTDCDDTDPAIHPGVSEVCNGEDDDCDGAIDEDVDPDDDGDGYNDCQGDCDETDPAVYPGADEVCDGADNDCDGVVDGDDAIDVLTWYADADGDGYGDPGVTDIDCDQPTGYVDNDDDCDDGDADVSPGASEVCNDIDDDCDGVIDEDDAVDVLTWYADDDGDGYGDPAVTDVDCDQPTGYVSNDDDCDDDDDATYPGAPETCDGVTDNDCDGEDDPYELDDDGDGYSECDNDCDDADNSVHPGATELCNGLDEDCDGAPAADETDADGDGVMVCDGDCDDANAEVHPGVAELCNDIDDDCDGTVDEDDALDAPTWYRDNDADGHGDPYVTDVACDQPTGYVEAGDDCDDTDGAVYPGADEYCNGVDDDCDGTVDEDDAIDVLTWYADDDGDGYGDPYDIEDDCDQPTGYVSNDDDCDDTDADISPEADELCNGIDDDCDGTVDEDDAIDALTWYADDDGDGHGDPNVSDRDSGRLRPIRQLELAAPGVSRDRRGLLPPAVVRRS